MTEEELSSKYSNVEYDPIEKTIFDHFINADSPHHYISYKTFKLCFPVNKRNFPDENRNIIDVHLKYNNFIFN